MKKLALLLLPLLVQGQTLSQVVVKVENNDLLKSFDFANQSQKEALSAIKSAYLPKVTASAMYQYIDEDQRGPFDAQANGSLEASYVLFDGFRRYNSIKAQRAQVDSTQEQKLHQKEYLTLNAIKLYFNLLSLDANMDAKRQKLKQLASEVERLEKFFQAGSLSEDKVEQIKAAFAMTQYELALLSQNYQDLSFSLSTLTQSKVDRVEVATLQAPLQAFKEQETHEIMATKHAITSLDHQARSKDADYWPTIQIKDTFSGTAYYPSTLSFPGMEISLPTTTNKIQVVAQMTLFDFFGKSQEKASVMLQKRAKEAELAYKKREQQMKQKLASIEIKTAQEKIKAAEQSLKSSQKSFDFINERFKVNLVDSVTYLDALSTFYESKALLAASKNDLQMAYANYYFQNAIPLKEKIQ